MSILRMRAANIKPNNTHDTENRNVFGIFLKKFKKGIDKVITIVYNVCRG